MCGLCRIATISFISLSHVIFGSVLGGANFDCFIYRVVGQELESCICHTQLMEQAAVFYIIISASVFFSAS